MTDKIEDTVAPESRESKRARSLKAEMGNLLDEVVEVIEAARKDGFVIGFSIGPNQDGTQAVQNLTVSKTW